VLRVAADPHTVAEATLVAQASLVAQATYAGVLGKMIGV
jgi:hypothetical protein